MRTMIHFLHKKRHKKRLGPSTFRGMGPYCNSGLRREVNSQNAVKRSVTVNPKSARVVCTHASSFAIEYV